MIDIVPIGVALAVVTFAIGALVEARARRRALREPVGTTSPALYPRINTDACICSGMCVPACPEENVLAIVDGRPRVVRPSACVGHAECLRACPVSAIELVLGTPERAVAVSASLRAQGVLAKPIRPPTVPHGTSRVRFALSAGHTEAQLAQALAALQKALCAA